MLLCCLYLCWLLVFLLISPLASVNFSSSSPYSSSIFLASFLNLLCYFGGQRTPSSNSFFTFRLTILCPFFFVAVMLASRFKFPDVFQTALLVQLWDLGSVLPGLLLLFLRAGSSLLAAYTFVLFFGILLLLSSHIVSRSSGHMIQRQVWVLQGHSNRSGHSGLGRCTFRPEFDHAFRWCTSYCNCVAFRNHLNTVTVTYSLQLMRIIIVECPESTCTCYYHNSEMAHVALSKLSTAKASYHRHAQEAPPTLDSVLP